MKTLNRILISDLRAMWRQGMAISILLACGITVFVMSTSAMRSLEKSRDRYYEDYSFADVFASLTRAPIPIAERIKLIPGVGRVQTRVVRPVLLDMPSMAEPASCRLVSIDLDPSHGLNRIHLRRGRMPRPEGRNEVIAGESFAEAHQLEPGDSLNINMDGRYERLQIVGIGLSPEYVYAVQPGLLISDNRRFGILWMPRRQMEAAFNMEGAFNDLSVELTHKSSLSEVIFQIDRILERYGGTGAYTREDQTSHRRVSDEMHQMRSMAYVTPSIFLAVAAFLFNIVLSRLVHQQKEQIATLRAFGYSRFELGLHYVKWMMFLVTLGSILGLAVGIRLSWWMIDMYGYFFRFPSVEYEIGGRDAAIAILFGLGAAAIGSFSSVRRAMQLQPAVAMRPDPPRKFGRSLLDRWGRVWSMSPMSRMIVRRLEASPTSTVLSILGIAMGVAVLVLGSFMRDTIDFVLEVQFGRSQRQDVMLTFNETLSANSFHDSGHLPGVGRVEPFRAVAVRLRNGARQHRLSLMGLEEAPYLYRILDENYRPIRFAAGSGITITEKLAELLDVKVEDTVEVEILENKALSRSVRVTAIFSNYTDPAAYMNRHDLHRLMRESERLSGAFLSLDSSQLDELYTAVKETPLIAGILDNNAARKNFRKLISENTRVMRLVNAIFGSIIAFGVIYNASLITLAESGRDLATLRVIGFSRIEVSKVLLGELAILTLTAIPVGLPIGYGFSYLATLALDTETHRFPLVIHRSTMAYASMMIILAATFSGWVVRRMLNRIDLIAVLKVNET
jgi:putative ABC transport system permease protein